MSRYLGHPDRHKRPRKRKPAKPQPPGAFAGKPHAYASLLCPCDPILLEAPGVTDPCGQCGQRCATFTARSDFEALQVRAELLEPVYDERKAA